MNIKLITACLVIGAVLAPAVVRAADEGSADRKHPVAFVKDSVITTKVKAKLAAAKLRTLAGVHVDTDKSGMVVLSGHVKTQDVSDKAAEIARGTEGVTSVQNNIVLK